MEWQRKQMPHCVYIYIYIAFDNRLDIFIFILHIYILAKPQDWEIESRRIMRDDLPAADGQTI